MEADHTSPDLRLVHEMSAGDCSGCLGEAVKRTARDMVLLGRVWAELGSGRITEGYIPSEKHYFVEGEINGSRIVVNPAPAVVDSALHEVLHRLQPEWHENYVRRTVTYIMRRMTDEEVQAMYEEYQKRSRKRKKPMKVEA